LTDSTNNDRAIARADGAIWVANNDREPEAIEDKPGLSGWSGLFCLSGWFNSSG